MVKDKSQETVEQREINLLVDFREDRLHHDVALALARLPDVRQVVDALAPLVHEKRRRLGISGLDPSREETTFVRSVIEVRKDTITNERSCLLEEQELVQVLTKRVNIDSPLNDRK